MEARDANDLVAAHEWAYLRHNDWKTRSAVTDLVAANKWSEVWNDLSDEPDPLVENTLLEALEDKAYSAASVTPRLLVVPSVGTKKDRGEMQAQKKRHAFISYQQRSQIEQVRPEWNLDWFQHGARYAMPWVDWQADTRFPYFIRQDPRNAFPLSHDSLGNLTSIFFAKDRRLVDLENEWGKMHPAILELKSRRHQRGDQPDKAVEEIWYFDSTRWAVAILDTAMNMYNTYQYKDPRSRTPREKKMAIWLAAPEKHNMSSCPVVEDKRASFDGEYRGALDAMVPNLGTAQRLMSAVMEDVAQQIGAPVLLDNVLNDEDYGPGEVLIGDGNGKASMTALRQPSNFEANQHIEAQIEASRRGGKFPQQRTGDPGASIVSAKGTVAMMGTFNSELAAAQRGQMNIEKQILAATAEFDVQWCDTRKTILGFDEGTAFEETYTPSTLFKNDDYRVDMSFGGGLGLDQQNYMVQLATAMNLEGMSKRTYMQKTGLVDDVLEEETEMLLEKIAGGFTALTLQQAMEGGNMQPLLELVEMIDDGDTTARAAIIEAVKKAQTVAANGPGGTPGPDPMQDAMLQNASLQAGGIPGNAEGQPAPPGIGGELSAMLPSSLARAQGEVEPG